MFFKFNPLETKCAISDHMKWVSVCGTLSFFLSFVHPKYALKQQSNSEYEQFVYRCKLPISELEP